MGQSMFFIGSVIGSLLFGILADKYGRLHILVVSNLMALVGNGLTVFTTNVVAFSIFRLLAGMATDSNFVMMYILGKASNLSVLVLYQLAIIFSNGIHSTIDANIWPESVHWPLLLHRIDCDAMDCRGRRQLEMVSGRNVCTHCGRTVFLLFRAGKCHVADIKE